MKVIKTIYWWSFIVILSFKWIFKTNLGDEVKYKNNTYTVMNGVRPESWRLSGNDEWTRRSECKKIKSIKNVIGSFKSGYRFYMGYWFDIWRNSGVETWMKACRIW